MNRKRTLNKSLDKYEKIKLRLALSTKKALTFCEGCIYLDLEESYVYKLTSAGVLPYCKPLGKKIFFDREKLDEWKLSGLSKSCQQKEIEAATYVTA